MIKTYLDLFGTKITPSNPSIPVMVRPSSTGWISYAQTDLANYWSSGTPENALLSLLDEKYFQSHFGKRFLRKDYATLNEFHMEYSLTEEQAKKECLGDFEYFLKSRIPVWVKMFDTFFLEYDPGIEYLRHEEGNNTLTKSGTESRGMTGSEELSKTGSEEHAKSGKEITTPYGTETTTVNDNFNGYNSDTSVPVSDSSSELSFDQRKDELSFDQRKDTTTFNNRKDTKTFNNRSDTLSFTDREDSNDFSKDIYGTDKIQETIEKELRIRETDLYFHIHKEIADKFLLGVY